MSVHQLDVLHFWVLGAVAIVADYIGHKLDLGGAYTTWILMVWSLFSAYVFLL